MSARFVHRKPRHKLKQEEQSRRMVLQRRIRRALILAGILILVWYFVGGDLGLWAMWRFLRTEHYLRRALERERRRAEKLDETIERLSGDTLYIEQVARTRFGMIRDGERVFIFKQASPGDAKGSAR